MISYSRIPPCKYTYLRECDRPGSALKTGGGTYYWCMRLKNVVLTWYQVNTQQWTHNSSLCRGEQHVMIYEENASAVCLIWAGHLLADKWQSQIQSVSELVKHKKVDPKRTNLSKAFLLMCRTNLHGDSEVGGTKSKWLSESPSCYWMHIYSHYTAT